MELSEREEKEVFQQKALFGETSIFSPRKGIDVLDGREHLELRQSGSHNEPGTVLTFHPDGTLAWMSCLCVKEEHGYDLFDYHVIDEGKLQDELAAFYSYASWFFRRLSANRRPVFSLYTEVALYNEKGKKLGKKPSTPPDSMSIGMGCQNQHNPLLIPEQPLKMAFSKLSESPSLCRELMHLVIRTFKADGLYYEPQR
jgi:hypothetical protein